MSHQQLAVRYVYVNGKRLRAARLATGLSQVKLAQAANVSQASISNLERCVQVVTDRRALAAVAEVLGVDVERLIRRTAPR